jgi:hypothetical protein
MNATNTLTTFAARPAGMRRFARAALLAATLAIGASTFGHTAIASAEWDIEKYDNCMQRYGDEAMCCFLSEGVTGADGHCRAPAGRILQQLPQVPLGPRLGSAQPPVLPTTTLGTPVS